MSESSPLSREEENKHLGIIAFKKLKKYRGKRDLIVNRKERKLQKAREWRVKEKVKKTLKRSVRKNQQKSTSKELLKLKAEKEASLPPGVIAERKKEADRIAKYRKGHPLSEGARLRRNRKARESYAKRRDGLIWSEKRNFKRNRDLREIRSLKEELS